MLNIKQTAFISILVVFLCILCECCNPGHSANERYRPQFAPALNRNYIYNITNTVIAIFEVNGKEVKTTKQSEIDINCMYERDTTGNYKMKVTFDKFYIVVNNNGTRQVMKSENAGEDADQIDKVLHILAGSSLNVFLNKSGQAINVTGGDEINWRILAALPTYSAEEKEKIRSLLNTLTGENFIKNNFSQVTPAFDTAMSLGFKWNDTLRQTGDISYESVNNYELRSFKNGLAHISVAGSILNIINDNSGLIGVARMEDFKGSQEGSISKDTATGILVNEEMMTKINGNVMVNGKPIALRITIEKKISSANGN